VRLYIKQERKNIPQYPGPVQYSTAQYSRAE
jgi:hypothetical protein